MVKLQETKIKGQTIEVLNRVAKELKLEEFGWQSGFYQRTPRKITATGLVLGFWQMQQLGKNTLRNWAVQVGAYTKEHLTKQSLDERLEESGLKLVKGILAYSLNKSIHEGWLKARRTELGSVLRHFNRIMIHDSTIQLLPDNLSADFPGNYSHGEIKALFRLQALFNFTDEKWEDFSVDAYSVNDQSRARWSFPKLKPRDLVLKDLGYFTLESTEQLIKEQFLITRWHPQVHLFYPSGEKINLMVLLKDRKQVDMPVLVGSKKRLPMRLVAKKLPKKKATQRIKEARQDRHANTNHSKKYFQLLRFEVYLTNIPQRLLNATQIAKLHGLRWYIEILFKSWKSYANFKKMFLKDHIKYYRTVITIYLLLIQFVYLTNDIYQYVHQKINEGKHNLIKFISTIKFMDVVNDLFSHILSIEYLDQLEPLIIQFETHAVYEKRKNRKNMKEKYLYFKELCIE